MNYFIYLCPMNIEQGLKQIAGIYIIRNLINKNTYIGSSINLYNRAYTYRCLAKKNKIHNKHLQNAINKYGLDNFEFCKIEAINIENLKPIEINCLLLKREQYYINLIRPIYNIRSIVDRNIGLTHTNITKLKISEALRKAFKCGERKVNRIYSHNIPVSVFNIKGDILKRFDGLAQCAEYLKVTYQSISYTINSKKRICKSYIVLKTTEEHLILNYINEK